MKKEFLAALAALVLIVGLALNFTQGSKAPADLQHSTERVGPTEGSEAPMPGSDIRAATRDAAYAGAGAPAAPAEHDHRSRGATLPEIGGHGLYRGEVLDTGTIPLDQPGTFHRTRLLRTDFHAPLLRVEETVRFLPEQDEALHILQQLGMVADHVLVRVLAHVAEEDLVEWLERWGYTLHSSLPLPHTYRVSIPAHTVRDLPEALDLFSRATDIFAYAEPDHVVHSTQTEPNDPAWLEALLWGLRNSGQQEGTAGKDIGALEGWQIRKDAPDIIVGVIDTGILYTHEDLAANMWVNPGETLDGNDTDGNGYIDDLHGINAITRSGNPRRAADFSSACTIPAMPAPICRHGKEAPRLPLKRV